MHSSCRRPPSELPSRGDSRPWCVSGCLIRGETPHFDYIAQAASAGIMRAAQTTGVPVAFGLLTTNTVEEAVARSTPGPANKGREAAMAAAAMVRLYARLSGDGSDTDWDGS